MEQGPCGQGTAHGEMEPTKGRRLRAPKEREKQEQTQDQGSSCGRPPWRGWREAFEFAAKQVGPDGCSSTLGEKERMNSTKDVMPAGPGVGVWAGVGCRMGRGLHTHHGGGGGGRRPP